MTDLRQRARIPYGYRIVDGKAVIDEKEAGILKKYFDLYLSGLSMAEAAGEAGLECSKTTYRNLLKRKAYTGTDYYPAIISIGYQEKLLAEKEGRKKTRKPRKPVPARAVCIYTDFYVKRGAAESVPSVPSILYQMIRPKKS